MLWKLWDQFRVIVCEQKKEKIYRNEEHTMRRLRMMTHFMLDEDL